MSKSEQLLRREAEINDRLLTIKSTLRVFAEDLAGVIPPMPPQGSLGGVPPSLEKPMPNFADDLTSTQAANVNILLEVQHVIDHLNNNFGKGQADAPTIAYASATR